MNNCLSNVYGKLLIVRPPVPATVNKAGANYKSEIKHLSYSPRQAFDEWTSICESILACGGDALFQFEESDDPFLDAGDLHVDGAGAIFPAGSSLAIGHMNNVLTGRVFTANGPWVVVEGKSMRAVMPNMLEHRVREVPYYQTLLERIADDAKHTLDVQENPHRWEGMADVAVVGDRVILTYAVPGHYDADTEPKTPRSCKLGVDYAADVAGVGSQARIHAELVYPHFHGDTVHFGARPSSASPVLVHYPGGLWGDGSSLISSALGPDCVVEINRSDAVDQYAGNSRQVGDGVLVPDGVSAQFVAALEGLGLSTHRVPLFELFGKAGGGPACATLYMPRNLELPQSSELRYSLRRDEVQRRRARLPETLTVAPEYFEGRRRG